jgi:malonyl CoA-acyl carrier protein transacylase
VSAPSPRAGDGFAGKAAVLIAVLATIGTLFGFLGSGMQTEASLYKSNAAIDKTSATNAWNHYQAKSNKQNLAELALAIPGVDQARYRLDVARYRVEKEEIRKEAERWEASSREWNAQSERALHRHRQWMLASVVQQIAISLAAVALLARRTWLLTATCAVASFGLTLGVFAALRADPMPIMIAPFAAAGAAVLLLGLVKRFRPRWPR